MSVPSIPDAHLESIFAERPKSWTSIDSYRRDAIDTGEWLRSRIQKPSPLNWFNLALGALVWAVVIVCTAYAVGLTIGAVS